MKFHAPGQLPLGYDTDTAPPKAANAAAVLSAHNLRKKYKSRTVVTDVSFEVAAGEVVGLLGPNGAGKTTVFNLISRIYTPTTGTIDFAGPDGMLRLTDL
ncbi:MAG: ATP-binding cassette domain-containing protein, partial [Sulfuritalea sp.]|nr:ATP-binding cassette domain-containing protein [Sulfuritalea sp.]